MKVVILGVQEQFNRMVQELFMNHVLIAGSDQIEFVDPADNQFDARSIQVVVKDFVGSGQDALREGIETVVGHYNFMGSVIEVNFLDKMQSVTDLIGEVQSKMRFPKSVFISSTQ